MMMIGKILHLGLFAARCFFSPDRMLCTSGKKGSLPILVGRQESTGKLMVASTAVIEKEYAVTWGHFYIMFFAAAQTTNRNMNLVIWHSTNI